MTLAADILGRIWRRDAVRYEGLFLPAKKQRFCGPDWKDDAFYVSSAEAEVDRLVNLCALDNSMTVLDIGSGQGRLATGLIRRFPNLKGYDGVDVHAPSIRWCQNYISDHHPNFRFHHLDVENLRYNPDGRSLDTCLQLPFDDNTMDVVFLYSVFTHMLEPDVRLYLGEIARVMSPSGHAVFTAFAERDVPDVTENPTDYLLHIPKPDTPGPLHRVRYEVAFFKSMVRDAGLEIVRFDHASETVTGQSLFIARHTG